ncbi:alpha-(1,3)-fucosyltransferase C-like isoform X1 [Penaeus japonicus]|uniref:alpha-(1,3)-fucosyltransferase C-like isoform X1 n=1 Tax=Penaeus japonicus TaxID=27405 RepID=UPI001C70F082|nr:alpha-(1,3)-fucosyltransferase C-like isoform X1 [Penaeus japonicus]
MIYESLLTDISQKNMYHRSGRLVYILLVVGLTSLFAYFYSSVKPTEYNFAIPLSADRDFSRLSAGLEYEEKAEAAEQGDAEALPFETVPPSSFVTHTTRSFGSRESTKGASLPSRDTPLTREDALLPYEDEKDPKFSIAKKEFIPENITQEIDSPPLKKILFWNDAYSNKDFGFGFGREPFLRAGCRVNTCYTTGKRDRFPLKELDALIWHFRANDRSLPEERSPHTRYVFWMMESASHLYGDIRRFNNLFNWTMSYRLDSDLVNPYNRVYRRRQPLQIARNYTEGKTKMAAWFVSNCNTIGGRESLVKTLQKWIGVDIYGGCGPFKCERKQQSECHRILNETYKFYLSFENSLCQDYVTEKFFNILRLDVIPVVYGLGNYSVQAPPHSYIDALSFPTVKDLADYLLYLDRNHTAYNEYFQWKANYFVSRGDWARVARAYCTLCERLHTDTKAKTYNLFQWFVDKSHCLSRSSPRIRAFIGG